MLDKTIYYRPHRRFPSADRDTRDERPWDSRRNTRVCPAGDKQSSGLGWSSGAPYSISVAKKEE